VPNKAPAVIVQNPTDKQLSEARAIWKAQHSEETSEDLVASVKAARQRAGLDNSVKTDLSKRMFEKHAAETALKPKDISKLRFIPWDTIAKTLMVLNPTIRFTQLPDAKIAIGFAKPSRKEVADWEKIILTPSERIEVMKRVNHQGPRPFLVAASRGWVAPYSDLLTKGMPVQIISRSLKSILRVLIAHGGFTWPAAEARFGFRLLGPGTDVKREFLDITPRAFAENRPMTRI